MLTRFDVNDSADDNAALADGHATVGGRVHGRTELVGVERPEISESSLSSFSLLYIINNFIIIYNEQFHYYI